MIIIGIDPGTTRIGFGVIKKSGNTLECIDYGLLPLSSSKDMPYKEVFEKIRELADKHKPSVAAVEKLFFFKNQKTIISVSEMRGVIMAALSMSSIPIYGFTPLQVKQAVSSYGRAGKDQVELMARLILGLKEKIKPDDAADALAIAICCANTIIGNEDERNFNCDSSERTN